jgi:hypothetical protein
METYLCGCGVSFFPDLFHLGVSGIEHSTGMIDLKVLVAGEDDVEGGCALGILSEAMYWCASILNVPARSSTL